MKLLASLFLTISALPTRAFPSERPLFSRDAPPAAPEIKYTGFAYGAFWSPDKGKRYADFRRQFLLARNLPNVTVPFTSARLFQTAQWNNGTEPSEAFQAAIDTNTTLLLGLWLPLDNEIVALDRAFQKHGQQLVDLVVGISIGNEDIYRASSNCQGQCNAHAIQEQVRGNVTLVRNEIKSKEWYGLFKTPPPIGHVDTGANAALLDMDFVGTNIYPYWVPTPIENARQDFDAAFRDVMSKSGSMPVWITETGWPSSTTDSRRPGTKEMMEEYWKKVGCSLFGKHNVWWFELENDSESAAIDFGIIDIQSQTPKFDLSCPSQSNSPELPQNPHTGVNFSTKSSAISPSKTSSTISPISLLSTSTITRAGALLSQPELPASSSIHARTTVYVTVTDYTTIYPTIRTAPSGTHSVPLSSSRIQTVTTYQTVFVTPSPTVAPPQAPPVLVSQSSTAPAPSASSTLDSSALTAPLTSTSFASITSIPGSFASPSRKVCRNRRRSLYR